MEGRDDTARHRTPPRRQTSNGVRRHNVHLGFSPGTNDPSARFNNIVHGYESLNILTQAISQSFMAPLPQRPHQLIDVARDYNEATLLFRNATGDEEETFYSSIMTGLNAEHLQLITPPANSTTDGNINDE